MMYFWKEKNLIVEDEKAYPVNDVDVSEMPLFEESQRYLDGKNKVSARELLQEIIILEQQCMRPLIEIHYLQEQGKDIAKEKAFLNQRYADILIKRAQLQALDN